MLDIDSKDDFNDIKNQKNLKLCQIYKKNK